MANKLLSAQEAAKRLGVSRQAVYDIAKRGELTPKPLRQVLGFDPEEIEKFRRRREKGSTDNA